MSLNQLVIQKADTLGTMTSLGPIQRHNSTDPLADLKFAKKASSSLSDPDSNKDSNKCPSTVLEIVDNPSTDTNTDPNGAPLPPGTVYMTPKELRRYKLEGMRVVFGGILIHLVLGTFYLWGSVSLYVSSYLLQYDSAADIDTVKLVFPMMLLAINVMLPLGVSIGERFGQKLISLIATVLIAVFVFAAGFITNFAGFVIVYGVLFGFASGLVYMTPVACGWKYFPHRKGAVSGFIIGGFGFGTFIFNFVALAIVNPNNEKASVLLGGSKYFTADVYSNVPKMFKILAACYLALGVIGALMIRTPKVIPANYPPVTKSKSATQSAITVIQAPRQSVDTVWQGLKTWTFFNLLLLTTFASFYGMMFTNNYKVFGFIKLNDDLFLTTVGSVGSACNGISRVIWASLTDKFGFKRVFFILLVIQSILIATLDAVSGVKSLFLIWYMISMSCEGGQLSMLPAVTYKVFGVKKGTLIYGFVYAGFTISTLASFFLTKYTQFTLGWGKIFWICFGFSLFALILDILFNENPKFKKEQKTVDKVTVEQQKNEVNKANNKGDVESSDDVDSGAEPGREQVNVVKPVGPIRMMKDSMNNNTVMVAA